MEGEPTEASKFAVEWFSTLLGFMDVKGTVTGIGNDERVRVTIEADKAGRIIGKRGSTLRAIRTVLGSALKNKFGDLIIDVDVADNRDESERPERRERNDRDDRGDRGGRSDRGGRGGERGGRGGDRGAASSAHPAAKLEALAKRAGEKAVETNKTITINLELNSYDRRIVHMAIAEIDGVDSRSEERDGKKFVQVMPASE
jgi:predicted RNA-binding protein Jag